MRPLLLALVLVLATARGAAADDPPIAKPASPVALAHLARATRLYNVRSFEAAAEEYKAGALVEPAPVFDYNLGQCYRQLGRYEDAIWHYDRFLKASPDTPERAAVVAGFIAQMRGELEKRAMVAPPTDPAPAPIVPPNAAAATGVATAHWYDDRTGWVLAGGGVLALAGSAGLLASAAALDEDANATAMQSASADLHERAGTRLRLGAVVGIAGFGLVTAGAIKLWSTPADRRTIALAITPGGFIASGRF